MKINVIGSDGFNLYNIMRITQIILGSLILVIGGYTLYSTYSYKNINKVRREIKEILEYETILNTIKQKPYKY